MVSMLHGGKRSETDEATFDVIYTRITFAFLEVADLCIPAFYR